MHTAPEPRTDTDVRTPHGWWWKALIGGAALWLVTAAVTYTTQNTNLVPTVILLGSFLVPFCVVLFVVERARGTLDTLWLFVAFFVGGIFGVLGASILESRLLEPSLWIYVGVGAIEELVKAVVFLAVGARIVAKTGLKGALLGAVVGAGFAAFESAGYAFNASLTRWGSIDLTALLETEAVRGLLTPVGHVLWTAILGAAIFRAASADRYRFTGGVLGAYGVVLALHALWDSMSFIAAYLAIRLTGGVHYELAYGQMLPTAADNAGRISTILYVVGLAVISWVGITVLRRWARPLPVAPAA
ncbi:PrsW family intramembrane metalloprotease [Isoptericola sp. BMS4]|uniref:PrsW family intramembrane metalloprotease n=1 Tax=Isoptericola sp. BMS4 TaxID=2527875 RepID=UPI0014231A9A|nr:PrsW family glutamic-type intramembrane protease [Isoptericola sp. BMS4]